VVDRDRLAQLDEEGWTTREIGDEFGISAASVSRLLQHHRRLAESRRGALNSATAEISEGTVFRGVNKGDRLTGDSLTSLQR
jgi:hypothetical protein